MDIMKEYVEQLTLEYARRQECAMARMLVDKLLDDSNVPAECGEVTVDFTEKGNTYNIPIILEGQVHSVNIECTLGEEEDQVTNEKIREEYVAIIDGRDAEIIELREALAATENELRIQKQAKELAEEKISNFNAQHEVQKARRKAHDTRKNLYAVQEEVQRLGELVADGIEGKEILNQKLEAAYKSLRAVGEERNELIDERDVLQEKLEAIQEVLNFSKEDEEEEVTIRFAAPVCEHDATGTITLTLDDGQIVGPFEPFFLGEGDGPFESFFLGEGDE